MVMKCDWEGSTHTEIRLDADLAVSMMQDRPHFLILENTERTINIFILQTTDV